MLFRRSHISASSRPAPTRSRRRSRRSGRRQPPPSICMKASLGLVEEVGEVEPEIDRLRREGVNALLVVADPIIDNFREHIAEAAIARGLPTAGQISFYADAGFLVTYAPV